MDTQSINCSLANLTRTQTELLQHTTYEQTYNLDYLYDYTSQYRNVTSYYWYDFISQYLNRTRGAEETTRYPINVLLFILCPLGLIANFVSIAAVRRLQKKASTHLTLIISLCLSDALILLPTLAAEISYMVMPPNMCFNVVTRLITDLALFATLLNLLLISVDHYFAILRPLLYKKQTTHFLGNCVVAGIWLASLFGIALELIAGFAVQKEEQSLCEAIEYDELNHELAVVGFIFIVLLGIILIYARIYIRVKQVMSTHRNMQYHHVGSGSVKALVTTSLFVGTFVLFVTPIGVFNVYMYNQTQSYILDNVQTILQTSDILFVFLLLNTIADPVIYVVRLPQVRGGCKAFVIKQRSSSRRKTSASLENM